MRTHVTPSSSLRNGPGRPFVPLPVRRRQEAEVASVGADLWASRGGKRLKGIGAMGRSAAAKRGSTVLVPDWYAPTLGPPCHSVDDALAARFPAWVLNLAAPVGPLRGILLFVASAGAERVALLKNAPGT